MANKSSQFIEWFYQKYSIHNKFLIDNLINWFTPRGSIYTCLLGENIGYEKGNAKEGRPVLIVSSDSINRTSGNVVVIPLSKDIKWQDSAKKRLRFNYHYVLYKAKYIKLTDDSAVQCEDIRSISKARLGDFICFVDPNEMKEINKRIKNVFQI